MGLLNIHLLEAKMRDVADPFRPQKMQLDVTMLGEDDKGQSFDFKNRTRMYIAGDSCEVPEVMSKMITEMQVLIEEKCFTRATS